MSDIALTRPDSPEGTMQTRSPILTEPASTLPASEMAEDCGNLKTSEMQKRSGLSMGFSPGLKRLMPSSSVRGSRTFSLFACSFSARDAALYQEVRFSDSARVVKFSPLRPLQGTNQTSVSLKPTCLIKKLP